MSIFELIINLQYSQEIKLVWCDWETGAETCLFIGTKQSLIENMTEELFSALHWPVLVVEVDNDIITIKYEGR